jgi:hypothetical protein
MFALFHVVLIDGWSQLSLKLGLDAAPRSDDALERAAAYLREYNTAAVRGEVHTEDNTRAAALLQGARAALPGCCSR